MGTSLNSHFTVLWLTLNQSIIFCRLYKKDLLVEVMKRVQSRGRQKKRAQAYVTSVFQILTRAYVCRLHVPDGGDCAGQAVEGHSGRGKTTLSEIMMLLALHI